MPEKLEFASTTPKMEMDATLDNAARVIVRMSASSLPAERHTADVEGDCDCCEGKAPSMVQSMSKPVAVDDASTSPI